MPPPGLRLSPQGTWLFIAQGCLPQCHGPVIWMVSLKSPIQVQGRRKQSPDGQAQLDVGGEVVNNSREKHAAKICTLVFLAVRRRSHCTSASNWDSKAWKFSHIERKSYACARRYVPCRIFLQQFETIQM